MNNYKCKQSFTDRKGKNYSYNTIITYNEYESLDSLDRHNFKEIIEYVPTPTTSFDSPIDFKSSDDSFFHNDSSWDSSSSSNESSFDGFGGGDSEGGGAGGDW